MNIPRAWTGCHWYDWYDCPPKSTNPIISYGNIDFDLRLFIYARYLSNTTSDWRWFLVIYS